MLIFIIWSGKPHTLIILYIFYAYFNNTVYILNPLSMFHKNKWKTKYSPNTAYIPRPLWMTHNNKWKINILLILRIFRGIFGWLIIKSGKPHTPQILRILRGLFGLLKITSWKPHTLLILRIYRGLFLWLIISGKPHTILILRIFRCLFGWLPGMLMQAR